MYPESFVKKRVVFSSMLHTKKYINLDGQKCCRRYIVEVKGPQMNISTNITNCVTIAILCVYYGVLCGK